MNKKSERKQNLTFIFDALRRQGPMAQAHLKEFCNLQASTVSYLIRDLRQCGMIADVGKTDSIGKVGKPGSVITLNNAEASFLGIYVEDYRLHAFLVGIDGTLLGCDCVAFSTENVEETIISVIKDELKQHAKIRGIGLTVKAIVYNDGSIKSGIRHGKMNGDKTWNLYGLPDTLRGMFPEIPIIVENDANSAAELYRYESAIKNANFIVYLLNRDPFGIGCGLMINGGVYRGAFGAAGEFFEKNFDSKGILEQVRDEGSILERFFPSILPHVLETAYLLNPARIVFSGSIFDALSSEGLIRTSKLFSAAPMPVEIRSGESTLNPARGVALIAINAYVARFVEEVDKR